MPKPKNAVENARSWVDYYVPDLTPEESDQIVRDSIDKLSWADVIKGKNLLSEIPDCLKKLSPEQSKALEDFLDKLPESNKSAIEKIKKQMNESGPCP